MNLLKALVLYVDQGFPPEARNIGQVYKLLDFLSSLFMTFIFIKLVRYADKYGEEGKLPVAVHILADELANTGAILELNKKISVIRSRNLSISCIFQNLPQMQNRYPYNQWQEIIGNCDTQLFLGCTDEVTATFISNRSGDVTVGVSSEAKQLNSWRVSDYTPEYRQTKSIGKRKFKTQMKSCGSRLILHWLSYVDKKS